jgi:hypothetical protein
LDNYKIGESTIQNPASSITSSLFVPLHYENHNQQANVL